ncbi:hypothetical protein COT97_01210 [Candidatus Falkowbacteria bacterium CG10_big_fil_rev_8_21_14_0_10_39_11]|uniref:Thioredoxin domain-containing protein n=1 Tax=Candidatus Falkowbacteria bacterium CG10_big_fil_rev_8_21_14_0_10_39_11 TaxID=1974565 RepID=A0A2H0V5S4_9BACT|nr:MAG: hypothetical protein COT97_01210 [Candidatus Falkowbacteria bacterium CG10_big_fil_rev_8_21_14_0_10_39_11]
MNKKLKYSLFFLLLGFLAVTFTLVNAAPTKEIEVVMFVGEGCPHCAKLKEAFSSLQQSDFPQARLIEYEVYHNTDNQLLFAQYGKVFGVRTDGVPITFIGNEVIDGENVEALRDELKKCSQVPCPTPTQLFEEKKKDLDLTEVNTTPANQDNYTAIGWVVIIMIVLIIFVVVITQMKGKSNKQK